MPEPKAKQLNILHGAYDSIVVKQYHCSCREEAGMGAVCAPWASVSGSGGLGWGGARVDSLTLNLRPRLHYRMGAILVDVRKSCARICYCVVLQAIPGFYERPSSDA